MDQLFKKRNEELKEFSSWLKRHKVKEKKKFQKIFLNNVIIVMSQFLIFLLLKMIMYVLNVVII